MTTYVGAALNEMTRKLKSKTSTYEGWQSMGPDQPRDCFVCGKPVHLNQDVGFRTMEPKLSWHFACALGAPPRLGT